MPGVTVLQTSRFLETKAVGGPVGQSAFLNAACLLETDLPPHDLLGTLQAVENTLERQRDVRWGPRTIDLDILLYDTLEIDHEDLTVPHPRMTTRRFVLEPCAEIAPDFLHPPTGCSIRDLLDNISPAHRRIAICGIPGCGAAEVAATLADATLGRSVLAGHGLADVLAHQANSRQLDAALALADRWHDELTCGGDDHAIQTSVCDFWVGSLAAIAQAAADGNESLALHQRVAAVPAPHVLILLSASPEAVSERIRFCLGPFAGGSDIFKDLQQCLNLAGSATSEAATTPSDADWTERLMAFQMRLESLLEKPPTSAWALPIPKAVVRINADDLGDAADEALAAVEAMA